MGSFFKKALGFAAPLLGGAANMFLPGSGALVSGILGGIGGSEGKAGGVTGQTTQTPWGPQAEALQNMYKSAGDYSAKYGQLSPEEQANQQAIQQYNTTGMGGQIGGQFYGQGQNLANQGYGAATNFLGQNAPQAGIDMGVMGQAQNNPYATATMDAMAGDVNRNLQRNILPSIRNRAGAHGLLGSTRAGVAEGLASSDATRQISDMASKYRGDLYQNALNMGGQFGMTNAQMQAGRQLQQAQMGSQLGSAGMGYMGEGAGYGQSALDQITKSQNYGRDIAGNVLGNYSKALGVGPTVLQNSQSGMTPATSAAENAITGIGGAISQYGQQQKLGEADQMAKYKQFNDMGGQAGMDKYNQWKASQPTNIFGGIFGS